MKSKLLYGFVLSLSLLASSASFAQTLSTDAQTMLDLAEELFAKIFKDGSALKETSGYVYRYYPSSGAYLGFKDGKVYTVGGPFGTALKERGSISQVTVALNNHKTEIGLNAGDIDVGNGTNDPDITGDFTLVIDGTVSVVVGGFATSPTAFSVTIEDIAGPDPTDTDEITDVINDTLDDVTGVQDVEIVVTNNTSSRITFTVSFTAVQNGVNVEMELEYDYTK